jgi:hypothetical protein
MKKRLYLSIPISGVEPQSKIKASQMQKYFEAQGYEVVSPHEIGAVLRKLHLLMGWAEPTWDDYMEWCVLAVRTCDVIWFASDWENSKGCREEMAESVKLKREIIYE